MKSILLPVHPEILEHILNGDAVTLIRKLFPKDYVGWVYLYCTKGKPYLHHIIGLRDGDKIAYCYLEKTKFLFDKRDNGKVVARFWCDKVDGIICNMSSRFVGEDYNDDDATFAFESKNECMSIEQLAELACIEDDEKLFFYLNADKVNYGTQKLVGYAIHISKLEVFDRPRELREFWHKCEQKEKDRKCANCPIGWALWNDGHKSCEDHHIIYEAPTTYCYIESEKFEK